jgi:recombination protein RecT
MDAKTAATQSLQIQVDNRGAAEMNQDSSDFRTELEKMLPRLAEASLRGMKPEFLMSSALSLIRSSASLRKCDKSSILHGIMQAALLGLRLDPVLGQCCLVPRKGRAQFMMMYKGLVLLAHRSGRVKSVVAQVVYENDFFEIEYGSAGHLSHRRAKMERGKAIGAYGFVTTVNGGEFFEYLTKQEIEAIRDRGGYDPEKSLPWKTDVTAMWEKTAIKQALKLVPTDDPALSTAMELDDLESRALSQKMEIHEGQLVHSGTFADDPEVPGDAKEETKRLSNAEFAGEVYGGESQPAKQATQPAPTPLQVEESPEPICNCWDEDGNAPCPVHGNMQIVEGNTVSWTDACLQTVERVAKEKNPDRKVAATWYNMAGKRLAAKEITQDEFNRIDKRMRELFKPKPIEAPHLELPLTAVKPAPPVTAPAETPAPQKTGPLVQPGSGLTATRQPKALDNADGTAGELRAEIDKASTIPGVLAIKAKINACTGITDFQKKALGQFAQDKFSEIKAKGRA